MPNVKLTDAFVSKAQPPEKGDRIFYWDTELRGFALQVTKDGAKSYVIQYRSGRRSHRMTIKGAASVWTLAAARKEAKALLGAVAKGGNPLAERRKAEAGDANSLRAIAETYLQREEKAGRMRSLAERRGILERSVFPSLGRLPIGEIRRSDIAKMLDKIEDERGPAAADAALMALRVVFNWHAARDDDFLSPLVRGMKRNKSVERDRTLTDEELRAVWKAADELRTPFARLMQFILLTGTRRNEALHLRRSEIAGNSWVIPRERYKIGEKHGDHEIFLTPAAQDILRALPIIGPGDGFVFSTSGKSPLGNLSKLKAEFDAACGVTGWTIHDLRRTARTLLSRAGVSSEVAERCVGHGPGGIEATYNRHRYEAEKRHAFEALAALLERIVNPPADNVVTLRSETQAVL